MLTHYYKDIPIYLILIISVYQIFDFQFEYSFALSLTTTIPVQNDPRFSAFDNETNKLYVTNHQSANVSVIDGASDTVIKNIKVGKDPFHLIHASTPTVATFEEVIEAELSTINQETESSQFFPLSKKTNTK